MSAAHSHLQSCCFFQISSSLPWSVRGSPRVPLNAIEWPRTRSHPSVRNRSWSTGTACLRRIWNHSGRTASPTDPLPVPPQAVDSRSGQRPRARRRLRRQTWAPGQHRTRHRRDRRGGSSNPIVYVRGFESLGTSSGWHRLNRGNGSKYWRERDSRHRATS